MSPSSYGTQGAAEFVRQAKDRSICVAQNSTFDSTERDSAADEVVTRMLGRGNASVVIVFLDPSHIQPFLAAIQGNDKAHGHFHFIGSEVGIFVYKFKCNNQYVLSLLKSEFDIRFNLYHQSILGAVRHARPCYMEAYVIVHRPHIKVGMRNRAEKDPVRWCHLTHLFIAGGISS